MKTTHILRILIIQIVISIIFYACKKDEETILEDKDLLTDSRDDKTYKIIKIGDQTWMAENLNYDAGSDCWIYENDPTNETRYGKLYNWYSACEVCPDGWHLPSDEEWKELEMYLGMTQEEADNTGCRGTYEGWDLYGGGTNSGGFSVKYGGYSNYDWIPHYEEIGEAAYFWTSSKASGIDKGWYRKLHRLDGCISRGGINMGDGLSVRCIKN